MTTKVLIVDDARTARAALRAIVDRDPEILVIGEASGCDEAVEKVRKLRPDLVTMDVVMEGKSGLDAIRAIMQKQALPIVVITSSHGSRKDIVYEALELGALDVLPKPPGPHESGYRRYSRGLRDTIRNLAKVPVVSRRIRKRSRGGTSSVPQSPVETAATKVPVQSISPLLIGASTGGPMLLGQILRDLGASFPLPILVAQHLANGFMASFASWLEVVAEKKVVLVERRTEPVAGEIFLPIDGCHLSLYPDGTLRSVAFEEACRLPSIDRLFQSAARCSAVPGIAVLLTGMGRDGAEGLLELRERGYYTIAQSPGTCVVAGMPGAAIGLGAAREVVDADLLSLRLVELARRVRRV